MKFLILLGVLYTAWASPLGTNLSEDVQTLKVEMTYTQLSFVANVDGKSYFADLTTQRSWAGASAYCKEFGMRLATITSRQQFEALNNSSVPEFRATSYWVGARDAENARQFVWHATNAAMSESYLPFQKSNYGYYNCAWFYKRAQEASYLSFYPCSLGNYVLCET